MQKFKLNKKQINMTQKLSCIFGLKFEKNYCHIWNQHLRIHLNAKFHVKWKKIKFGNKITFCGYFCIRIWKNYCHIWKQHPQDYQTKKFHVKEKNSEFKKMPCFCTLRPEFEKTIVIYEISTFYFVKLQSFIFQSKNTQI